MATTIKQCVIVGDLSSDSTSDQYPTVPICDDCIEADEAMGEDGVIIGVEGVDESPDATCELCGATAADD